MEEDEEDVAGAVSLLDDDDSLVEAGGILSQEECVQEGNWTGGPASLNNTKTSVAPYLPAFVPSTLPLASACANIVTNKDATLSPHQPTSYYEEYHHPLLSHHLQDGGQIPSTRT